MGTWILPFCYMAYIGIQSILRDRVLNADYKPPKIPESMWDEKRSKLRDEDVWDSKSAYQRQRPLKAGKSLMQWLRLRLCNISKRQSVS